MSLVLESQKDFILNEFDTGKSVSEIAKQLNTRRNLVYNLVKKYRPNYHKPSQGNVHYFDCIDTYAKAYIVGFIAADGALVKPSRAGSSETLIITIKQEDASVLEFIKSEIGNTHKLQTIERPCSYNSNKIIHHKRYTLTNSYINNALHKLGIDNNKSTTMKNIITKIPEEFRDAFIIGYFDGDGSVSCRDGIFHCAHGDYPDWTLYVSIRGTKEFLTGICEHLNITLTHIRQYDSIPTLSFASKKDVVRLYKCYNNLPFFYKRKHDVFLKRINHPSYDKYK